MRLSDLKTGEKAIIVKVNGHGGFRKRIVEMGFIKGKVVESILNAPLKDPIKYGLMGYEVSLRRSEAKNIEIISLSEAQSMAQQHKSNDYFGTISEDDIRQAALQKRKTINVALVGNPNSGKTSLFNIASGKHERVGNYGGVTVDAKEGHFNYKGYNISLVDLPGTYSLSAYSPEEKYVRYQIIDEQPDVIINVVDASNLERNLYLTTQLIDMNQRMVIALNMYDELQAKGDKLNHEELSKLLGIPIIPTICPKQIGVKELFDTVIQLYEGGDLIDKDGKIHPSVKDDKILDKYHHLIDLYHKHDLKNGKRSEDLKDNVSSKYRVHEIVRHIHINHGPLIESALDKIKEELKQNVDLADFYNLRYISIKLLEDDPEIKKYLKDYSNFSEIIKVRDREADKLEKELGDTAENAIMDAKYGFVSGALKETYKPAKKTDKRSITAFIDKVLINKYLSYPIFLFFMFLVFVATFRLGDYPMTWIEDGVAWFSDFLRGKMAPTMFRDMLIDGIIGGIGGVIVFLPNILILFFFITLMEGTGYMARTAFIMDKLMHKIGLHGRSFIPMIMGFGCTVPAVMATRTIENRNSRMITMLVLPFMSCSARLPVYLLIAGTFFPNHASLVIFCIYLFGIVVAAIVAKLLKKFMFKKEETPFVMELPPYRVPSLKYILSNTWIKGKEYLKKIASIILIASVIIWVLSYFPRSPHTVKGEELSMEMKTEQQENSYLGRIGKFIEPVMEPCGFNWKISIALVSGVAAKEIVVSTLGVLYSVDVEEDNYSLSERLLADKKADGTPTFTPAVAISLLLFVLIYFPCIATLSATRRESGKWSWAIFVGVYTIVLAWIISFIAYQLMVLF